MRIELCTTIFLPFSANRLDAPDKVQPLNWPRRPVEDYELTGSGLLMAHSFVIMFIDWAVGLTTPERGFERPEIGGFTHAERTSDLLPKLVDNVALSSRCLSVEIRSSGEFCETRRQLLAKPVVTSPFPA